jgi:hypothetical protein
LDSTAGRGRLGEAKPFFSLDRSLEKFAFLRFSPRLGRQRCPGLKKKPLGGTMGTAQKMEGKWTH